MELVEHGVHVAHDLLDAGTGAGAVRVNEDACAGKKYDSPVEDVGILRRSLLSTSSSMAWATISNAGQIGGGRRASCAAERFVEA